MNEPFNPHTDTPLRICSGLKLYSEQVAPPDIIVYQSLLWDRGLHVILSTKIEDACVEYETNINNRLDDVFRCKSPSSQVWIRTTPWSPTGGMPELHDRFNQIIRNVALKRSIHIEDWDQIAWTGFVRSELNATRILRDGWHPNVALSTLFGLHLLKA